MATKLPPPVPDVATLPSRRYGLLFPLIEPLRGTDVFKAVSAARGEVLRIIEDADAPFVQLKAAEARVASARGAIHHADSTDADSEDYISAVQRLNILKEVAPARHGAKARALGPAIEAASREPLAALFEVIADHLERTLAERDAADRAEASRLGLPSASGKAKPFVATYPPQEPQTAADALRETLQHWATRCRRRVAALRSPAWSTRTEVDRLSLIRAAFSEVALSIS